MENPFEHLGERFTDLREWRRACKKHHEHVVGQEHTRFYAFHSRKLHSYEHRIGYFYTNGPGRTDGTGWLLFPENVTTLH